MDWLYVNIRWSWWFFYRAVHFLALGSTFLFFLFAICGPGRGQDAVLAHLNGFSSCNGCLSFAWRETKGRLVPLMSVKPAFACQVCNMCKLLCIAKAYLKRYTCSFLLLKCSISLQPLSDIVHYQLQQAPACASLELPCSRGAIHMQMPINPWLALF